jgi:hypothetical protein
MRHHVEDVLFEVRGDRERIEPPLGGEDRYPVGRLLESHHRLRRGVVALRGELCKCPPDLLRQLERAVVADLVIPAILYAPLVQNQRLQVGRVEDRGRSLCVRRVRGAPHADLSIRVREARERLDRVVTVAAHTDVLRLHALGVVGATVVLQRDDIAVAHEELGNAHQPLPGFPVGRAMQQ